MNHFLQNWCYLLMIHTPSPPPFWVTRWKIFMQWSWKACNLRSRRYKNEWASLIWSLTIKPAWRNTCKIKNHHFDIWHMAKGKRFLYKYGFVYSVAFPYPQPPKKPTTKKNNNRPVFINNLNWTRKANTFLTFTTKKIQVLWHTCDRKNGHDQLV